ADDIESVLGHVFLDEPSMLRVSEDAVLAVQNFVFGAFRQIEEFVEIGGSPLPHFFKREASQVAYTTRRFYYKRRLVTLATIRHRRKKRTIGFNEHAIERDLLRGVANLLSFGEGHIACKRNHEPHIERTLRMLPRTGKTMKHSAKAARFPAACNQTEAIVPGVLAVL